VSGPDPSTIRGISAVVPAGAPILLARALSEGYGARSTGWPFHRARS
jgi:hypothetical protein